MVQPRRAQSGAHMLASRYWLLFAFALSLSCNAHQDLTVPPPTKVHASFKVPIPPSLDSGRLSDWVRPRGYRLALKIDPTASTFAGEVFIDVTLARRTNAIVLHGSGLTVRRAEVISRQRQVRAEATTRKSAGAKERAEELVLVTASPIDAGEATLHIEYTAPLTETLSGIYRAKEGEESYVFTQFEPSDARRMLPCFDDPIHKVAFDVEVTVPSGNLVFANTKELERVEEPNGAGTTFRFATSEPMPTYLLALAIGKFEVREGQQKPVPIRLITVKGKSHLGDLALRASAEHLEILGKFFDRVYPYSKLDLVAVPNFGPGAMENAGLVTFREELLLVDEKTASAKAKRDLAMVVAHELAHHWFGNLVTMKWWDDLWLNEGFATYLETLVVDEWRPDMAANLEMLSLTGWVMDLDALESARAVRQPVSNTYQAAEAFDGITYVKGASVIAMLHSWLGDSAFKAGVRTYIKRHAWGGGTASDMFAALAEASKEDVAQVASSFLDKPGVPMVYATLQCGDKVTVDLTQRRYLPHQRKVASDDARWQIPVCVSYGAAGRPEALGKTCRLLSADTGQIELPTKRCPGWINPNADYEGYYRYAMPTETMVALGKINAKLPVRQRVGYLTNAWALVRAGEMPATDLLTMLARDKREQARQVVEERIGILRDVSDTLIDDDARPAFEDFATQQLLPLGKSLGWDNRTRDKEHDRLMRRSVLGAMAVLSDDAWLVSEAESRMRNYLADPESVAADTATIALQVSARHGKITLERLRKLMSDAVTPAQRVSAVRAMASVRDKAELEQVLGMVLDGTLRAQDFVYVLRTAVQWTDSRKVLLDWLEANVDAVSETLPQFGGTLVVRPLGRACDEARGASARTKFEPVMKKTGGERRLAEALERVALCVDLRARQQKAVSQYFVDGGWK